MISSRLSVVALSAAVLLASAAPAWAQLTPSTLPNPQIGVPYSQSIGAPFSAFGYSVSGGTLPTGLSLSGVGSSATLSGTPTTAGPFNFTVRADGLVSGPMGPTPTSASQAYSVTVTAAPAPVPTMSEWALIGMGLALAGTAAAMVVSRRRTLSA